ncbi:MAG TPA: homocysteine S-methyltransferase family protein, partial [Vicinamibacteria bacterium]|nr:homocysteine S-methyltransferase family protein [Vicinamibacteria bacterium]
VMITMSFENSDQTPDGETPADCARALADAGADIVGVNCLRNPSTMLPLAVMMRRAVDIPIATQPTAYRTPPDRPDFTSLPEFPTELDPFQLSRREMADYAVKARDLSIGYIGACCGAVSCHIRQMALALGKIDADRRLWKTGAERPMSAFEYYGHDRKREA